MSRRLTVVLAAHGAGNGSGANARVRELASAIGRTRERMHVVPAFLRGDPTFHDLGGRLPGRDLVVVPLFAGDGYTSGRVADALARATDPRETVVRYTPPVGALPRVQVGVISRVAGALIGHSGSVLVVIVGHGTARMTTSGTTVQALAESVRTACPRAEVRVAFLDQDPRIEHLRIAGETGCVVVVPWFFGGGHHVLRDLPSRLGAVVHTSGLNPRPEMVVLPPIGVNPDLVAAILCELDMLVERLRREMVDSR